MEIVNQKKSKLLQFNAFHLRFIAMLTMFMDHSAIFFNSKIFLILNSIGRLAFPIFAFQIVEGYVHTKNFKKYLSRLFIFALISEIPYNLLTFNGVINPYSQNVLWTFFIGLIVIRFIDKFKNSTPNRALLTLKIILVCTLGYFLGNIMLVDYNGYGVLTVILFYLTRNCKYKYIIQFISLLILNFKLGGISIYLFGFILFRIQLLALLSLILIWFYNGEQGYTSKGWRNFCYWFYPGHIMLITLVSTLISLRS